MPARSVAQKITDKLRQAFAPVELEVRDDSHLHAGHAGARPEGETHFHVRIVSPAFKGKSRVDIHRQVNRVLAEELQDRVHALAIKASSPAG